MRIGFTGTQAGMNQQQLDALWTLLQELDTTELHHGDCVGADYQAHTMANDQSINVVIHPPDKSNKRAFCVGCIAIWMPKPYLERNKDIVETTEQLIAAPNSNKEQLRSGTWSTVRYAKKLGRTIHILNR